MATTTPKAQALAAFLAKNPAFDIHTVPRSSLDEWAWEGLDRRLVTDALRQAARLRHAVSDPLVAYPIIEAGYSSLQGIARRAAAGFVEDMSGVLEAEAARAIQARARGAFARIVQQWMQLRESVSQHRRALFGPKAMQSTGQGGVEPTGATQWTSSGAVQGTAGTGEATPPHYATLFGEAPIRDTPDAMSIFGAGAYFYDLMDLIDEEITAQNPYVPASGGGPATGIPPALTLQARRPDLWNLPLTIRNVENLISQADLSREILESTLLQLAPQLPLLTQAGTTPLTPKQTPSNVKLCRGYDELKDALDNAVDGDLLVVLNDDGANDIKVRAPLRITKNVTLQAGASGVTFHCSTGAAFTIIAPKVSIEDLGFTGASHDAAIVVERGALTLVNTLFVHGTSATSTEGWAVRCAAGEITSKNATFFDASPAPMAMLAATATGSSATFTLLSSILWTDAEIAAGALFNLGEGNLAVVNLSYCDVRGGDPRDPRIFFDDTSFTAEPGFQGTTTTAETSTQTTNYLKLTNTSPCVGRGARGVNVGAAVYDVYAAMARAIYPFDVPFDTQVQSAVLAFDELDLSLPEVFAAFRPFGEPGVYSGVSTLGMGLGDFEVLSTPILDPDTLAPYYGLTSFDEENVVLVQEAAGSYTFRAAEFARWTGLTLDGLRELVYQNLSLSEIAVGIQQGKTAWGQVPAKPWQGFYVNAGQLAALALCTVYAPVGRMVPTLGAGGSVNQGEARFQARSELSGTAFTIQLWMVVFSAGATILAMSSSDKSYELVWDLQAGGALTVSYYDNTAKIPTTPILEVVAPALVGRWACLTTSYDGARLTVYVNGAPVGVNTSEWIGTKSWASTSIHPLYSSQCVRARKKDGGTNPTVVAAADLSVWEQALAPEAVAVGFSVPPLTKKTPIDRLPQGLLDDWPLCHTNEESFDNWAGDRPPGTFDGDPVVWSKAYLPGSVVQDGVICTTSQGQEFVQTEVLTGQNDTGMVGLTVGNLDHVNRFVRLARRLDWTFAELDWALYTILPPDTTDFTDLGAFDRLAVLATLQEETGAGIGELTAFFGYLKPYGRGREGGELPPFDVVYNRPPLAGAYFTPVMSEEVPLPAGDDPDAVVARRIATSLGWSTAELRQVVAYTAYLRTSGQPPATLLVDWANLSALFHFRALTALLRMGITALLELLTFAGVDPSRPVFAPAGDPTSPTFAPADLLQLVEAHRIAGEAKISPANLNLLITDPSTIHPPGDPYQENLDQRFSNNLPELRADFRRDVSPVRVTRQSFITPGMDQEASAEFFQFCVNEGYLTQSGLCRAALFAMLPEVQLRVPAQYPTLGEAVTAAMKSLGGGARKATC